MTAGEIANALGDARREGAGWRCTCVLANEHAHNDKDPSFSLVDQADRRLLAHCHSAHRDQNARIFKALKERGFLTGSLSADGYQHHGVSQSANAGAGSRKRRDDVNYEYVAPVPASAGDADAAAKRLYKKLISDSSRAERFAYRAASGALLFCVYRFQTSSGKQVRPLSLWRDRATGAVEWAAEWPPAPLSLYLLEKLSKRPDARVLLVEGEKKADAAATLLTEYAVLALPGGAGAVDKVDFSPLVGREVVCFPDADQPGCAAMLAAARKIEALQIARDGRITQSVRIARPDPAWPAGHDVGDLVDAKWDASRITQFIAQNSVNVEAFEQHARERFGAQADVTASGGGNDKAANKRGPKASDLAKLITDSFAQDAGGKLYVYRDGAYRPRGEEHVRRLVRRLLPGPAWSSFLASEVVEYIRVGSPYLLETPPLDTLNLANGLLDIRTRTLRPHTPQFFSTVQLPVDYAPEATCPAWEKQIAETFPADAVEANVAWQIAAYLMLPITSLQKAILLLGSGGNGKSTFLAALIAFLGRSNITALSLHKLEGDKFAVARLIGKLANVCADLPTTDLESSSTFKAVTGGDALAAEHKFKESFDLVPFARLIFSANQPPRSSDGSEAFFERWITIPFDRKFRGADTEIDRATLDAALATPRELSGVLNRALDALGTLAKRAFTITESMRETADEFRKATDPLSIWLMRRTVDDPQARVSKRELVSTYNATAASEGRAAMTATAFGLALRRLRPELTDAQRTVNEKLVWCWLGIGLSAPPDGPEDQSTRSRGSRGSRSFPSLNVYTSRGTQDKDGDHKDEDHVLKVYIGKPREPREPSGPNPHSSVTSRK